MGSKRISALTEETILSSEYFFPIDGENGTRKYNLSSFQEQTIVKTIGQISSNSTFIGSVMHRGIKTNTNPMVYLEDYFNFKTGNKYFVDVNFRNYSTTATLTSLPTVNGEYLSTSIDLTWTGTAVSGTSPLDFYYQFEYGKDSSVLSVKNGLATTMVGIKCWDVTEGMRYEEPFKEEIGNYLFANCTDDSVYSDSHRIKGVFCNDYILSVGNYSFTRNLDLQRVYLINCESVGGYAFNKCSNLSTIYIPKCEHIDVRAFSECNINDAYLPQCSALNGFVFYNCKSLSSINISNCTEINDTCFAGCESLLSMYLPKCKGIGQKGFTGCDSLISVYLPECTDIGINAFNNCTSMYSITLDSCNKIGLGCFEGSGLSSIHLSGNYVVETYEYLGKDLFSDTPIGNLQGIIYVPKKLEAMYKEDDFWSKYSSIIVGV